MTKWRLPELINRYTDWREQVLDDKIFNELHDLDYQVKALKRDNSILATENRQLKSQLDKAIKELERRPR